MYTDFNTEECLARVNRVRFAEMPTELKPCLAAILHKLPELKRLVPKAAKILRKVEKSSLSGQGYLTGGLGNKLS